MFIAILLAKYKHAIVNIVNDLVNNIYMNGKTAINTVLNGIMSIMTSFLMSMDVFIVNVMKINTP